MKELLFCSFILFPGVKWFLKPGRFVTPKQSMQYATVFFLALSVAYVAYDLHSSEPSYYQFLGVSRPHVHASPSILKARFRELSLQWHPDRPTAPPNANTVFATLSAVHETLSDPVRRRAYDVFGFQFVGVNVASNKPLKTALHAVETGDVSSLFWTHVFPWYAGTAFVTILLTLSNEKHKARTASLVLLGLMCAAESWIKVLSDEQSSGEYVNALFPEVPTYRKVAFAQKLYHFLLQGLIVWSEVTFFDPATLTLQLLSEMHRNQQLLLRMVFTASRGALGVAGVAAAGMAGVAAAAAPGAPDAALPGAAVPAGAEANPTTGVHRRPGAASAGAGAAPDAATTAATAAAPDAAAAGPAGAGAAGGAAAGAGAVPVDPFVAYMQREMMAQQRFLSAQQAVNAQLKPQSQIPWSALIFLAIAVLNSWRR